MVRGIKGADVSHGVLLPEEIIATLYFNTKDFKKGFYNRMLVSNIYLPKQVSAM